MSGAAVGEKDEGGGMGGKEDVVCGQEKERLLDQERLQVELLLC